MSAFTAVPIHEIFDIAPEVHQGDFVLKLAAGLQDRAATLRDYVVTPQLATAFEQALGLVASAARENASKGAYLHGSFGAGKSHFMAVLAMLLDGDAEALATKELAPAIAAHRDAIIGRKFLVVPFHMLGATTLETGIFGGYTRHVLERHPDAPVPALYKSLDLFANARELRVQVGDAAFFAKLDEGGGGGWGKLTRWDATRFEAAMAAAPEHSEHRALVSRLVGSWLSSYRNVAAGDAAAYVGIDDGLAIVSQHAKALGYDGVILFLDELILWLASKAGEPGFMGTEGAKLAKLVEGARADRPIPLVSFIARQRDLSELLGQHLPGAERQGVYDVLNFTQGRFDVFTLEDRNLPLIAQRRLLRPKSDAAKQQLEAAFAQTQTLREDVRRTLVTNAGTVDDFKNLYPFSPALVQVLIALSNALQRERSALKLLALLLSRQRNRLMLGEVVPAGDLFDVLMDGGEEPFLPQLKEAWRLARQIWHNKFLPMLEKDHGVTLVEVEAGTAAPGPALAFTADARLAKTLVLAALSGEVESMTGLTGAKLAALNHGTIKSTIPGQAGPTALARCRQWAAKIGELKISEDANPTVSLHLVGVDTEVIITAAQGRFDNAGTRRSWIKRAVFDDLGLSSEVLMVSKEVLWRGKRHAIAVQFENVREMNADRFPAEPGTWKVIIDYPFDEGGMRPADDRARLLAYLDADKADTGTLAWLPDHFAEATLADLGNLVTIEHLLTGEHLGQNSGHLSFEDRERARQILDNQRSQLRASLKLAIREAYGLAPVSSATQGDFPLAERFVALHRSVQLTPPAAALLAEGFERIVAQALEAVYPGTPRLAIEVTESKARHAWTALQKAVEDDLNRAEVDKAHRADVRAIVEPLNLAEMGGEHLTVRDEWSGHFVKYMALEGVTSPTVRQLRAWISLPKPMALTKAAEDLIIMVFTAKTNRSFFHRGVDWDAELGKLPDDAEVREDPLPDVTTWSEANRLATLLFGIPTEQHLSSSSLRRLTRALTRRAKEFKLGGDQLAIRLPAKFEAFGLPISGATLAPRLVSAKAGALLVSGLAADPGPVALCLLLAEATVPGTGHALAKSMSSAADVASVLDGNWATIVALRSVGGGRAADATAVLSEFVSVLQTDEQTGPLAQAFNRAQTRALEILTKAREPDEDRKPDPEKVEPKPPGAWEETWLQVTAGEFDGKVAEIRTAIEGMGGRATVKILVTPE